MKDYEFIKKTIGFDSQKPTNLKEFKKVHIKMINSIVPTILFKKFELINSEVKLIKKIKKNNFKNILSS